MDGFCYQRRVFSRREEKEEGEGKKGENLFLLCKKFGFDVALALDLPQPRSSCIESKIVLFASILQNYKGRKALLV